MIKREFKAQMVDDFYKSWVFECSVDESMTEDEVIHNYGRGMDLETLSLRISGQVVTMTENEYPYSGATNDFFEKEDNNFVIFPSLFTEIKPT